MKDHCVHDDGRCDLPRILYVMALAFYVLESVFPPSSFPERIPIQIPQYQMPCPGLSVVAGLEQVAW